MKRTVKVEDAGASGSMREYLTLGVRSVSAIVQSELTNGYTLDHNRRCTVVSVGSKGRDTAFSTNSVVRKLAAVATDDSIGKF